MYRNPEGLIAVTIMPVVLIAVAGLLSWLTKGASETTESSSGLLLSVAGSLVVLAAINLALLPAMYRESRLQPYRPLSADGIPQVGSRAVERLAIELNAQLADTPYIVATAPHGVQVRWAPRDCWGKTILSWHRVDHTKTATLQERYGGRFVLNEEAWRPLQPKRDTGRRRRYECHVEVAAGPDGMERIVDHALVTDVVSPAVSAALATTGLRRVRTWSATVGLVYAVLSPVYAAVLAAVALGVMWG